MSLISYTPNARMCTDLSSRNVAVGGKLTISNKCAVKTLQNNLSSGTVRYISTTSTYVMNEDVFAWGLLLNTGAISIQFPSLATIQTAVNYVGYNQQIYTYSIINNNTVACNIIANTGGIQPFPLSIPANSSVQIAVLVNATSYTLYNLISGPSSGTIIGEPTGLWQDIVTSASIPNPSFFLYRDPGILTPSITSNVTAPVIKCVNDLTDTKLFFVAWYDLTQMKVFGMAFTYNVTTAAFNYGNPTQIDIYTNPPSHVYNYVLGVTVYNASSITNPSSVLVTYSNNYSLLSSLPLFTNYVTISGVSITPSISLEIDHIVFSDGTSTSNQFEFQFILSTEIYSVILVNSATSNTIMIYIILINGSNNPIYGQVGIVDGTLLNASTFGFVVDDESPLFYYSVGVQGSTTMQMAEFNGSGITLPYTFSLPSYSGSVTVAPTIEYNSGYIIPIYSEISTNFYIVNITAARSSSFSSTTILYTYSAFTFTSVATYSPTDYDTAVKLPLTNVFLGPKYLTYSLIEGTFTVRLFTVDPLSYSITLTSTITLPYTPGGASDSSIDVLDNGTRFIVCNSLPTDLITLSGGVGIGHIPLVNLTNTKPLDLVPYGGGIPVPIVSTHTMLVELLPSTTYYSHTRLGYINDSSSSTPGVIGDAVNLIGTTNSIGNILTFS